MTRKNTDAEGCEDKGKGTGVSDYGQSSCRSQKVPAMPSDSKGSVFNVPRHRFPNQRVVYLISRRHPCLHESGNSAALPQFVPGKHVMCGPRLPSFSELSEGTVTC